MFGIDSSNMVPDHAIFGHLEGGRCISHASQTHISCMTPPKPYTRTAFVAVRAVCLATNSKTALVNGSSSRLYFSAQKAACHLLLDDSNDKRLVQLCNRLPRGSQAAWRHSRLRNVIHDQCGAVEHKTHIHTCTFLWRAKKDRSDSRGFCIVVGENG